MGLFYVLKVVINDASDILEIKIDKFNNEKDSYEEFDKWLNILKEKSSDIGLIFLIVPLLVYLALLLCVYS